MPKATGPGHPIKGGSANVSPFDTPRFQSTQNWNDVSGRGNQSKSEAVSIFCAHCPWQFKIETRRNQLTNAHFLKLLPMSTIQTQGTEETHPDILLVNRARA